TPKAAGQIVNIGNDAEEVSIDRLVDIVLRLAEFAPAIERRPAPAGSPSRRCPDIGRLRALTGFAPKIDLASGVRQTFAWHRERDPLLRGVARVHGFRPQDLEHRSGEDRRVPRARVRATVGLAGESREWPTGQGDPSRASLRPPGGSRSAARPGLASCARAG